MYPKLWILSVVVALTVSVVAPAEELDDYLRQGRIAEGLQVYNSPSNDAERFSLAMLRVFAGLEQFSRDFNALGVRPDSPLTFLPFLRIVVPYSGQPPTEPASPAQVAEVFRALRASLREANGLLAEMNGDEFGVPVNLTQVHLDFDGNGSVDESETLFASLSALMGSRRNSDPDQPELLIRFDAADAVWLRGYTHFVSGVLDILLAYDWRPVWDQCAHLLFMNPDPQPPFNRWAGVDEGFGQWVDLIAALHDMRLEMTDDEAWPRARQEFQNMIASSRACWKLVLDESDNENEWLPSPTQTGPMDATISQQQIDGWMRVLDELEAITRGEKLLPHWRVGSGAGINLDKLVESPPELDLVLWIQGSALIPYLEEGPVSDAATWDGLSEPFGPGFIQFAIWSN